MISQLRKHGKMLKIYKPVRLPIKHYANKIVSGGYGVKIVVWVFHDAFLLVNISAFNLRKSRGIKGERFVKQFLVFFC